MTKKKNKKRSKRIRITPANVVGFLMGAGITEIGLYQGIVYDDFGGYFFAGTGLFVMALIILISWYKS